MTTRAGGGASIPARITPEGLAKAINRDVSEITAVLRARGERDSPAEYMGSAIAEAVAEALGTSVVVESRDLALEALYEHELRGEALSGLEGRAHRLALGVVENRDQLDHLIEEASEHWSVARMPLIDRNILRLGLHELQTDAETPTAVIISQAVRLAQTYSTERSSAFVNGVLATLAARIRD